MNTRQIGIALATAIAWLMLANAQTGRPTSSGPVGRYQPLSGEHVAAGVPATIKDILRIDSVTGETSIYMAGRDKSGHFSAFWLPIPDK